MYICLNNGEETEKIINRLQALEVKLEVEKHDILTWINVDSSGRYHAYFDNFVYSAIILFDVTKQNQDIMIPLNLISTIYEL